MALEKHFPDSMAIWVFFWALWGYGWKWELAASYMSMWTLGRSWKHTNPISPCIPLTSAADGRVGELLETLPSPGGSSPSWAPHNGTIYQYLVPSVGSNHPTRSYLIRTGPTAKQTSLRKAPQTVPTCPHWSLRVVTLAEQGECGGTRHCGKRVTIA